MTNILKIGHAYAGNVGGLGMPYWITGLGIQIHASRSGQASVRGGGFPIIRYTQLKDRTAVISTHVLGLAMGVMHVRSSGHYRAEIQDDTIPVL